MWCFIQILAPVPHNGDIICIGLNYRKHAEEANVRRLNPRFYLSFWLINRLRQPSTAHSTT
jgi:2-keto-4-pentenoate hydratase/2-oxohepta-3-ene-1,7-dioic acid hydratase in catechol pathway